MEDSLRDLSQPFDLHVMVGKLNEYIDVDGAGPENPATRAAVMVIAMALVYEIDTLHKRLDVFEGLKGAEHG